MSDTKPQATDPSAVVDEIIRLFRERGDRRYGEDVTERTHSSQCALLAEQAGCPPALVAAALLHDVGHLLHDLGEDVAQRGVDAHHEVGGDRWLRQWFGQEVTEPARLHVAAKRYLCTIDAAYRAGLSSASARSLELQGGLMTPEEVAAFEASPHHRAALQLRHFDDRGKDSDKPAVDLERFRPVLEALVLAALTRA